MSDAILVFTFSPVQSYIAEARRAADLFTGSRILVLLARASAEAIIRAGGTMIYPASLTGDVPNKLLASVPWEQAESVAELAKNALITKWKEIAQEALIQLEGKSPAPDAEWHEIWNRQVDRQWEIHWAAAALENQTYPQAFDAANRALESAKRLRAFEPSEEDGVKDTLSGRRSALRNKELSAKDYWTRIADQVVSARLRPKGRERLDAIGAIKRFCALANTPFPSTSTVASADFLERIRNNSGVNPVLHTYVQRLDGLGCFRVRQDPVWPFDGDLLYQETLTFDTLKDDYRLTNVTDAQLLSCQSACRDVYQAAGGDQPTKYYALIVFDGDNMGKRVSACPTVDDSRNFSQTLDLFSSRVQQMSAPGNPDQASVIYNGGDDVMAMVPLSRAIPFALKLADAFYQCTGNSGSAGIVVAHHTYPLSAVLRTAHDAEFLAKEVPDKNAVCVQVLKRSGETLTVSGHWADLMPVFENIVNHLKTKALSSKFAYEVEAEARTVTAIPDPQAWDAMLRRLINRHRTNQLANPASVAQELTQWAQNLENTQPAAGLHQLGQWLLLARFIAMGGGE